MMTVTSAPRSTHPQQQSHSNDPHSTDVPAYEASQVGSAVQAPITGAEEPEADRQRRMSRFSTLSSTPTVLNSPSTPTPPIESTTSEPSRPSVKEVTRKHPRNAVYAVTLLAAFLGVLGGWVAYLSIREGSNKQDGFRGGLVVNALFVVVLIVLFLLISRQLLFIYRLFQPIQPNQTPTLPPWLVGRPPTYREALRTGGRGTGDVEDGIIAGNESLPKYGETTGSTLLARSQSRGGAMEMADAHRAAVTDGSEPASSPGEVVPTATAGDATARLLTEREEEVRQIEEARRLQAGSTETSTTSRDDKWETVPMNGR